MKTLAKLSKAALVAALALVNFACYPANLNDIGGRRLIDTRTGEVWGWQERPRSPLP